MSNCASHLHQRFLWSELGEIDSLLRRLMLQGLFTKKLIRMLHCGATTMAVLTLLHRPDEGMFGVTITSCL